MIAKILDRRFSPSDLSVLRKDLRLFGQRAMAKPTLAKTPEWFRQMYREKGPAMIDVEFCLPKTSTEKELKAAYEQYFAAYEKRPTYTDFRYFIRFLRNAASGRIKGM